MCSWDAGIVMKPILRDLRSEAMSRTRTPGPGTAPGPTGAVGAVSLLELGRKEDKMEQKLDSRPPTCLPLSQEETAFQEQNNWFPSEDRSLG